MAYEHQYDPLDEKGEPVRDGRGRFLKGSSGNPRGRKMQFPRDPNLPASRRRVVIAVADEEVEVKVNGKTVRMTMYEANVRALAHAGVKDRIAAQRFIDLVTETSETDLKRRLITQEVRQHYDRLEEENERLREQAAPQSGAVVVPCPIDEWPPEGLIDDERRVNMVMARELQEKRRKRDSEL